MHHRIDLAWNKDEICHIMADEQKLAVPGEVDNVIRAAGDEIIHPDNGMAFSQEAVAKMRPEKTCCSSN